MSLRHPPDFGSGLELSSHGVFGCHQVDRNQQGKQTGYRVLFFYVSLPAGYSGMAPIVRYNLAISDTEPKVQGYLS
jgi:hypothetical protein